MGQSEGERKGQGWGGRGEGWSRGLDRALLGPHLDPPEGVNLRKSVCVRVCSRSCWCVFAAVLAFLKKSQKGTCNVHKGQYVRINIIN